MFEGKNVWEILNMGGFTMYILLGCSVLSVAVILERVFYFYRKSRNDRIDFMDMIELAIGNGDIKKAISLCEQKRTAVAAVVMAGLKKHERTEKQILSAMERELATETAKLERFTSVVGTIGNVAVYIGLFGTVLGIVRSFHSMASAGTGGLSVVIGGVAEALICTATGLCVAIPAVVAYNYFMRRVDGFVVDMENCLSQTIDFLMSGVTIHQEKKNEAAQ